MRRHDCDSYVLQTQLLPSVVLLRESPPSYDRENPCVRKGSSVAEKVRFQTTWRNQARLELFERDGVLIACGCGKCANINQIQIVMHTVPSRRVAKASCPHCGKIWELPYSYDSLPLFLATDYRGHRIWALNEQHLGWLEAFIGADARDDNLGGSSALHAILPRWMTASRNRKDMMKVFVRLRQKLDAAR